MKNNFLSDIIARDYFHQCTDKNKLDHILNTQSVKAYIGFDCTAPSLHVGSLLQIMCLRLLQKHGHQPIVLLGGGTTMIGDPSGKDSTRKILDNKTINYNIEKIKKIFSKLLKSKNKNTKPIFVNNAEWLTKLNYIDFLREIGKHFTINKMLSFDSVKLRLEREQSLSYMEFNYMILQAYDFHKLNNKYNCLLQIGGSDQWGNIINGVELIRKVSQKDSFGLTTPLITLASGAKMGKTEKGAIWLDKDLLSPYDYWQFWRNTDDKDVKRFLKYFTDIEVEKINDMVKENNNINELKILLANETTKILYGNEVALKSSKTAQETFQVNGFSENLPQIKIKKQQLKKGIDLIELISSNKLVSSKSEVRRLMKNRGVKLNNNLLLEENKILTENNFKNKNILKISLGKKKHYIIKII
tara:strand:- start:56 stop:1297 length:1242 start_codon:yes stop_codon:yes gene_type:complete